MRSLKNPFDLHSFRIQSLLVVMLLIGAFLRFSAVDYALPYIVNADEPNVYRLTQDMRGVLESGWRGEWLDGYPPGYMAFYAVVVEVMNRINLFDIHQDMSKIIGTMRIFNSFIDLLTMSLVIYLARRLGGWRAALLAGSLYMVSVPFVRNASIALRDPLFALTSVLCVVFGLWAWRRDSVRWGLLSTIVGLISVAVKYPAAPVLILPALFFLRQLWTRRAAALPGAAAALILVLGSAYWLWFVYGGGNLNNIEAVEAKTFFVQNLVEPERWFNVLKAVGGTFGVVLTVALVLIALDLLRKRKQIPYVKHLLTEEILLVLATGFAVLAIVPAFLADIAPALYPIRYTLPAAAILLPAVIALLIRWMRPWPSTTQLAVGVLCVVALLPDLASYALPLRLINPFNAAQKWFETNVPDQSTIWIDHYDPYVSLSRYDKGYRGLKSFVGVYGQDNPILTPEIHDQIEYVYMRVDDEARWPIVEGWQPLDEMTLIKSFSGPAYNTPYLTVYVPYLLPNAQETVFASGSTQIVLKGIDIQDDSGTLTLKSYWQAPAVTPTRDYSYSVYITPADEPTTVLAQHDAGLGQRPTSRWDDPTEILLTDLGPVTLPADAEGELSVWLVVYDSQTGERFTLADGTNALLLETLEK